MCKDVQRGRRAKFGATSCAVSWLLVCTWLTAGCAAPPRGQAVPQNQQARAEIPGMPGIRFGAQDVETMSAVGTESVRREQAYLASAGHSGPLPPAVFLALSGG